MRGVLTPSNSMGLKPGLYKFFIYRETLSYCGFSSIYPHTLTLTLTTETPINRAFQAESEGVRVEKEKKYFYFLFVFLPVFSCCFIAIHDFKMELVYIHLYLLSPSGKNQPYLLCISPERSSGFLMCFYDCLQSFACLSAIRHHDATVLTGYPDVFI